MRELSLQGRAIKISKQDFLQLIRHLAQGYSFLVTSCHNYHVSGFADWQGTLWKTSHIEAGKLGEDLEAQITDEELRQSFHLLKEHVDDMLSR